MNFRRIKGKESVDNLIQHGDLIIEINLFEKPAEIVELSVISLILIFEHIA